MAISTENRSVLYVEGDAILGRLFQKNLAPLGYAVDIARDGGTALTMHQNKVYDVIVIDQNLPVLSGLEVLEKVAVEENHPPVIMLTGLGGEEMVVQALKLGANDFMIKDADGGYLRLIPMIIEKVIQQRQIEHAKRLAEDNARKASQRFRHLVETISDIIAIVDTQGNVSYISPSVTNILGYERPALTGHNANYIHPEDFPIYRELIDSLSKQGLHTHKPIAMRVKHHDGDWRWMEGTATNLLSEPTIRGIVINLRDVTASRQAQQTLEQERNILRTLIDSVPAHIYIKDRAGRIQICNRTVSDYLGASSPDELVGKTIVELQGENSLPYHNRDLKIMENNEVIRTQEEIIDDKWYLTNKIPLINEAGEATGIVSTRTDITARKAYEQKIIQHNHRLLALQVASASIAASLNVSEVVRTVAQEIAQLTDFHIISISRWHEEENYVQAITYHDAIHDVPVNWGKLYDLKDYPETKKVLTDWNIIQHTVSNTSIDSAERLYMQEKGIKSHVMIPIVYQNHVVALAELEDSHNERLLDAEELLSIELLLHQAGIALENARLYEQSQAEINKRQQVENALRDSEAYFRSVFEEAPIGIVLTSVTGQVLRVNRALCEMLGYSNEELRAMRFAEFTHPDDLDKNMGYLNQASADEISSYRLEKRYIHKQGHHIHAILQSTTIQMGDNKVMLGQMVDISERKRTEQSLLIHQQRLHTLHQMASQQGVNIDTLLNNALRMACESLAQDIGIISHIDDPFYHVQHIFAADDMQINVNDKLLLKNTFCEITFAANDVVSIAAMGASNHKDHPCYAATKLESYLGIPVFVKGERYGTLNFSSPKQREKPFTEVDTDFIRLMAQWVGSVLDREEVERSLRESEERFRIMFEMAPIGIYLMTMDNSLSRVNQAFCNLLGYEAEDLQGKSLNLLVHPDDMDIGSLMSPGMSQPQYHVEQRYFHKEGHIVYTLLRATWLFTSIQEPFYLMGQVVDITDRKLAEQELSKHIKQLEFLRQIESELTQTLDIQSVLVLALDTTIRFSHANLGYIGLYTEDKLTVAQYVGVTSAEVYGVEIGVNTISARVIRNQEAELITDVKRDPNYYRISDSTKAQISLPLTSSGRILGILGLESEFAEHFTQERFEFLKLIAGRVSSAVDNAQLFNQTQEQIVTLTSLHEQLVYQATHDPLTGLPNRAYFHQRLDDEIFAAQKIEKTVGLLYIDLDGFKRINDTMGHPVGDIMLQQVAYRLQQCIREVDMVARMGGDEFTVVLSRLGHLDEAKQIADRILISIREPYYIQGQKHFISASIGLSFFPIHGHTADELLRKADNALYNSKDSGKNTVQMYDTMANRRVFEQVAIGNLLHDILERGDLEVYYQPQISMKTGQIVGVEALVRWPQSPLGIIPPAKFLPIANDIGLLIPISNWVMSAVFKQQQQWMKDGINILLSVNIAIPQFQEESFVKTIHDMLNEYHLPPAMIALEVTEQLMLDDLASAAAKIEELRKIGVKIALDDFGTGYSSLSYLQKLHIDTLKLDRSLVIDIDGNDDTSAKSKAILTAILSLARSLNVKVIAEGVETITQQAALRQAGVDVAQGFLISPALPSSDFEAWLRAYKP